MSNQQLIDPTQHLKELVKQKHFAFEDHILPPLVEQKQTFLWPSVLCSPPKKKGIKKEFLSRKKKQLQKKKERGKKPPRPS